MDLTRRTPLAMYFSAMGMELCGLYIALALVRKSFHAGVFPLLLTLALYPLSLLSQVAAASPPHTARQIRILSVALGVMGVSVVTLLAIKEVLAGGSGLNGAGFFWIALQVVFCGFSWGLGNTLVREKIDYRYFAFRFQIALLFILLLGGIEGTPVAPIVLFFALGALALALARWQNALANGRIVLRPFQPGVLALSSVGLILSGFLIVFILSPEAARSIWQGLAVLGRILLHLFSYLPPPQTGKASEYHFSCSWRPKAPPQEGGMIRTPPAGGGPTEIPSVVLWAILIGILIGVLAAMILTVRKIRANRSSSSSPAVEVEIRPLSVKILGGLASVAGRLRRWAKRLWLFLLAKVTRSAKPGEEEAAKSVRELYRSLLRWAAQRGIPRTLSDTPLEYLGHLCQKFPEGEKELTVITDAYIQARYSLIQRNGLDLKEARRAWQRIKSSKK
jgi:hypothetical protein